MKNEREEKKNQFTETQNKRKGPLLIVVLTVVVIAAAAGWLFLGQGGDGSASGYKHLEASNGELRISLAQVSDGEAHYFTHKAAGGDVSFFVVKSVDGVMRAAFDACDVCYREKKGYRQDGSFMVCNNCDMRFRTDLVNEVKGGCNPAPLERRVEGDDIVIRTADITKGSWYFN